MTTDHTDSQSTGGSGLSRRRLIQLGAAGVAVAGAGTGLTVAATRGGTTPVGPTSPLVAAAERKRPLTGKAVSVDLRARAGTVDLGGRTADTWLFNGQLPMPKIRANVGDEIRVLLQNDLPKSTSVHWHGLALRNDMDGVPGVTQRAVASGDSFQYAFTAPHPGTYWFHPHVGVQLDTGLQAALIIEDPNEKADYDEEAVLILDDWTDGVGASPDAILKKLGREGMGMGMGMGGMKMGRPSAAQPLGEDGGDVEYPLHLINGKPPTDPATLSFAPGKRIRLRLINAGSDTAYRFAIGGHRLTVTHTDGFPVEPVEVDALILGMGERYDVVITAADGVFPIVAVPESKDDVAAMAVLRTSSGATPRSSALPTELAGRVLGYGDLTPTEESRLDKRSPDRRLDLDLTMSMGGKRWLLNGKTYGDHEPLEVSAGERVRVTMRNRSMMYHPMHLHGHTFALAGKAGTGIRKDTVNVLPMGSVTMDFEADNPGQWLVHCHNAYHGELGMMTVLSYEV